MLRVLACLTLVMSLTACERTDSVAPPEPTAAPGAVAPSVQTPPAEQATADTEDTTVATATVDGDGPNPECGGECGEGGECGGGGSCGCKQIPDRAPRTVPATAQWTELSVQGMRCGGCAKKIEAAVASVEGVYDVRADYRSGTVRFAADSDIRSRVTPRITALGYRVP